MADPEFVVLDEKAWLDAEAFEDTILGAIVRNFFDPAKNHYPKKPLAYNAEQLVKNSFDGFVVKSTSSAGHNVDVSLKSIAGFNFYGSTKDELKLAGKLIRWKRLQQVDEFWSKLKEDKDVQREVPKWIKFFPDWPVCCVVGVMICEDVELSVKRSQESKNKTEVQAPVRQALAAAGIAPPILNPGDDTGNPGISVERHAKEGISFTGKTGKSNIFALELMKVTTELFHREQLKLKDKGPRPKGRLYSEDKEVNERLKKHATPEEIIITPLDVVEMADINETLS